jgi:SAM-dependent methyltransferase
MSEWVTQSTVDEAAVGAFAQRVLADGTASITMLMAALGDRLGLFRALAEGGPATPAQLADRTGIVERYAREWLAALAAAGYLTHDPVDGTFTLPPAHVPVLAVDDTPASVGSILQWMLGVAPALPAIAEAFVTGHGVPPSAYGADLRGGMERLSAPAYVNALVPVWLAHLPAVQAALRAGAEVADVGCGAGRALVELARAFPRSRFVGFDTDPGQIERARANATAAGVADRVRFEASTVRGGPYDLVLTFDVVHDAGDPLALLRAVRTALRPGGTYLCAEVNGADTLAGNLNPFGALYYGVSVLYCLSVSLAAGSVDAPGAGLGSLGLPEAELAKLCARAGFATVHRLPIEDPMNAVYEVRP